MKSDDVRRAYLSFFEKKGHKRISPAPLVPENDPTTLFTSSGMQPLVSYLMGETHPEGTRLVDSQPCIRTIDIDEVGDNRHLTYFEMLGNWSLGDYFKEDQLSWIWEFYTKELGLSKDRLYVSVFEGNKEVPKDKESYQIWKKLGVSDDHIFYYDDTKNWWSRAGTPIQMPVGEPGGPTSEVFFEFPQVKHNPSFGKECHPNCDCGRFIEIGNSVFMVYEKTKNGLKELKNKNVDFGGGFERIVAATADSPDTFQTDIYLPTIRDLEKLSGQKYEENIIDFRIVADHLRASLVMVKEGILPSNKQQGYVLRRLIRRMALKFENVSKIVDNDIILEELNKFKNTLKKGLKVAEKIEKIDGTKAFGLYQSYGFPLEITREIFEEKGQKIDLEEFEKEFELHKNRSRTASAGSFKGGLADHKEETTKLHTVTHLLHESLRRVLGGHVTQKGSNITAERLRFDFSHAQKLNQVQLKKVEDMINEQIKKSLPVSFEEMSFDDAKKAGALANFADKYGERVKVYSVGDFSKEICGGPHVTNTKKIGHVNIYKQEKIGSGLIRIYAKTA